MEKLYLALACGDYDRTRALIDGTIAPEGIQLNYIALRSEEIFWRMVRYHEFDASEMSLSNYISLRNKNDPSFVAIPVFPSRLFRHSFVFINVGSGIKTPEDLKGKKMGVPAYSITAALWVRGFLKDDYGVSARDIYWFVGGQEEPGRKDRIDLHLPADIKVTPILQDKTLSNMLENGEIDALLSARTPSCFEKGSSRVRRLFPNYGDVEVDYYRRTKIFPIMHVVVIRREIYDRHPWVARSLYKAFCQAKEICIQKMAISNTLICTLPWFFVEIDQLKNLFGADWWPYGIEANRPTLKKLIHYMVEQGVLESEMEVDALFVPNTKDEFKI